MPAVVPFEGAVFATSGKFTVQGFKDKNRMRNFKKKNEDVDDGDIMYRVGEAQKFMEYHIRRLRSCADKGRVPFRNV